MHFFQKAILRALGQGHKLKDPHGARIREERQRQAESAPRALPPTRPRALTQPGAADQRQSPLFGKLSAELRTLIYEYVLADGGPAAGRDLHLANMHQRLGCIRCFHEGDEAPGWKHKCWGWYYDDGTHRGPLKGQPNDQSLLSLLRTCRLAYSEAIDILYTRNKFVVRQCKTLIDLERTVLPHRLQAIQFLHIDVPLDLPVDKPELIWPLYPPDPYHLMWVPACRVVARIIGLQSLRVTVYDINNQHQFYRQGNPDDMFVQLLEPLMDVKAPVFQVCLDAPIDVSYVLGRLGAAPFSIVVKQ